MHFEIPVARWHTLLVSAVQAPQEVCLLLWMQTVAYDGTNFQGFQYQTTKVRTVQGELEKAAGRVLLPVGRVVGASRTDAGAHAAGQTAHLDVTGSAGGINPCSLMMYMNGVLPDDVKVQQIEVATPGDLTLKQCAGTALTATVSHLSGDMQQ